MTNPNNPRSLNELVSVDAWRGDFIQGSADLHVDVNFLDEGRIGGAAEGSRVSFRLRLRKAEVKIHRDVAGVLKFPPKDILRPEPEAVTVTSTGSRKVEGTLGASIKAGPTGVGGGLDASASAECAHSTSAEQTRVLPGMTFQHRRTETGYAYVIKPAGRDALTGTPWSPKTRLLRLIDSGAGREKGECPDPLIQVTCKREDLIISDITIDGESKLTEMVKGSKRKILVAEQYLKERLMALSAENLDAISDPFTEIVLSDVVPYA